ncbi:MAG: flippase-like domain-containing protein [Thermoflexales bacterium]|nr:flippase-like domain-containing protein [Thermoflexales bacterium]MDW8293603.1 lysylphosphatidylglycerol synthase transmembrane domain-containing protein [Anaerolineae bacterium]
MRWRILFGFAISVVALYLTLRDVDFEAFGQALRLMEWWRFAPATLAFLLILIVRAARWSVLMGGVPFALAFHAMNVGYMLNMMLPLRVGELGRALVIGQRSSISTSTALSSIVVERLLDLIAVVGMFAGFAFFVPMDAALSRAALVGGGLALGILSGLVVVVWRAAWVEQALRWALQRLPWLHAERWVQRYRDFVVGLRMVNSSRRWALVALSTAGVWSATWLLAYIMMGAFLPPRAEQAGLMMVAANLGGAAPSAPGGLGPVQLFAKAALVLPFGVDETRATALVFVWSLSQQLALIGLGLIGLAQVGLSFGQLRASRTAV